MAAPPFSAVDAYFKWKSNGHSYGIGSITISCYQLNGRWCSVGFLFTANNHYKHDNRQVNAGFKDL